MSTDTDKPAALDAAKRRIEAINAREAERLRLAAQKRSRKAKSQQRGMS